MIRLTHSDQSAVLEVLHELYAQTELQPLRELMLRLATRLVDGEWSSYNEVDRDDFHSVRNFRIPDSLEVQTHAPSLLACVHEHPVLKFSAEGSFEPRTISDFLPQRQFERSRIFNEYYRHVGVRHQIFFSFDGGAGPHRTIAINRKRRGFSERDRVILNLLSPHFGQAYSNALRFERLHDAVAEGKLPSRRGTDFFPVPTLTRRENEVLAWIARGKSNPEIATIIGVSVRTVYKHVENLFAKLGVESRAQAMLKALEGRG